MAFVDFYQQSSLFDLPPHRPRLPFGFLTTSFVADGGPAYDLRNHSVFVDIQPFMQSVLHAPADWKTQWAPVIHAVKRNPDFMNHYLEHRTCHKNKHEEPERSHYKSLLLMNDVTIRVAFPAILSQDTHATSLPLTQLVHIVYDDEWSDRVLNEGGSVPHLITKGQRPPSNHTRSPDSLRTPSGYPTSSSTPTSETTRKRKRESDSTQDRKKRRPGVGSAPPRVNLEPDWDVRFPPRSQPEQSPEVGPLLIQLLSIRPHVTVGLVDRNRIQFYHANHSVVLVSSVIDLSSEDDEGGIDRLIAILIAFRRLSLQDRRILEPVQSAAVLRLEGNDKVADPIEIELGTAVSLSPSLVGRSTAVVHGTSGEWPDSRVVVKISWVDEARISEREFMDKAAEEAAKSGHEWATNHLPRFLYVEDVDDPTDRSVQELFKTARFANREYTYSRRQMRIVVQELLHPLETLTNARDAGQIMLDIACIHRWLYDHAGILHRDLSSGNIMYRIIEGQVHGVLTDYDLSSWKATLTARDAKSSEEATGTLPYMAQELLMGTSPTHLYRHDIESLFYVMLTMCGRHTICGTRGAGGEDELQMVVRGGKLPYQSWFERQGYSVGCAKACFCSNRRAIELSPAFEGFRVWLKELQRLFSLGFIRKMLYETRGLHDPDSGPDRFASFDDETLGSCIDLTAFVEPTRHLKGELEGLVIRYNPSS